MTSLRFKSTSKSTGRKTHSGLLLFCLTFLLGLPIQAVTRSLPPGQLLVGIFIDRQDMGTLEVIRQGEQYSLPLEAFARLAGTTLESRTEGFEIVTPLGRALLTDEDLREIDGVLFLNQKAIETKLATRVRFDDEQFALFLDLPWRADIEDLEDLPPDDVPQPDVRPPAVSFSTLRTDLSYTYRPDSEATFGSTTLGGRLGGGWWRLRYDDDFSSAGGDLEEYSWVRTRGNHSLLVGLQRTNLHPLLDSLELTGAQLAYTNQPLSLFSRTPEYGELLSRRLRPLTNLRGNGPPAGLAEVRIDGEVVARQVIGLDGVYEFLQVPLASRRLSYVEVLLYDRYNLAVPMEIHEKSLSASDLLLAKGAVIHLTGVGRAGDWLEDSRRESPDEGNDDIAGFYQWRYGLSERVSVEAAFQQGRGEHRQAVVGLVSRLGASTILGLGVGGSLGTSSSLGTDSSLTGNTEDALAYDATLESLRGRWRLRAQSRYYEAGYLFGSRLNSSLDPDGLDPNSPLTTDPFATDNPLANAPSNTLDNPVRETDDIYQHNLELGYRSGTFDLSLIGRSSRDADGREEFLLPALAWRPTPVLALRARPDRFGDYRYDLLYRFSSRGRLGVSHQDFTSADLTYRLREHYYLTLNSVFDVENQQGEAQPDRHSAILRWYTGGRWRPNWSAGAVYSNDDLGYLLAATADVRSGIRARVELQDPPGEEDHRLFLGLTADLAFARGRLQSGRRFSVGDDRGGIAGKVRVETPHGLVNYSLRDLKIFIDGQPRARTESGGTFFIGDLPAGMYRVELDPQNLPIELNPGRTSFLAEVAAAAVTRLDFTVQPEFGAAGRVVDPQNNPAPGIWVEILDDQGQTVGTALTDRFGLFRLDGLPVGSYTLRVAERSFPAASLPLPSRRLEVHRDFLFDQDLALPMAFNMSTQPAAKPSPKPPARRQPKKEQPPPQTLLGEQPTSKQALTRNAQTPPTVPTTATAATVPTAAPKAMGSRTTQQPTDLAAVISQWSDAWATQRVEHYLAFYSRGFVPPPNMSRIDWEQQRTRRLSKPKFIEVEIQNLAVESFSPRQARVRFSQTYRSDRFGDEVIKTLDLVREDGSWKIVKEQSQWLRNL